MTEGRRHFQDELKMLEQDLLRMAELAEQQVGRAVDALVAADADLAAEVVAGDQAIDDLYLEIHRRWLETMALQTPVARDLRLMSVALHLDVTLERMGDQATNIAKIARATHRLPSNAQILERLQEMGDLVRPMVRTAIESFVRRDLEMALRLPKMDEPVNRINQNMAHEIAHCGPNIDVLEWAVPMFMVSRALERVGDQAVDIAEQVAFLLTGEFQEFDRPHSESDGS